MSRKRILAALLVTLGSATAAFACLWDTDTLQMERLRFPGVLEIITGKFVRHSRAYYEWRLVADRNRPIFSTETFRRNSQPITSNREADE